MSSNFEKVQINPNTPDAETQRQEYEANLLKAAYGETPTQETTLLANKYKTEADLNQGIASLLAKVPVADRENYYKELQASFSKGAVKLPEVKVPETTEVTADEKQSPEVIKEAEKKDDTTGTEAKTEEETIVQQAGLDFAELSQKVAEKGTLDPSDYEAFAKMGIPQNIVDVHIRGLQAEAQLKEQTAVQVFGSQDNLQQAITWASMNLSDAEIDTLNAGFNGSITDTQKAVQTLFDQYTASNGQPPKQLVMGQTTTHVDHGDVYHGMDELTKDMMNADYGASQSFRDKVQAKIARSMKAGLL